MLQVSNAPVLPSTILLAWRQLLRDFRAGELRLLALAVVLAVAALTAVGVFAQRIDRGLMRDARQLLGADALLVGDYPIPRTFGEQALSAGLKTARTVSFVSMGRAEESKGGTARLVSVKAVGSGYPLRGQIKRVAANGPQESAGGPLPGTAWADDSLLSQLKLSLGDAILLGDARFIVAQKITAEPDRGAGFSAFAPRVMISESDLEATGLILPTSRATYRLLVAGQGSDGDAVVNRFTAWATSHIKESGARGLRLESMATGRPEMRQTLDRAQKFLNVVALLAALLAAVAVGIAARDFASRHLIDCAMLRVFGQSQAAIAGQYALQFGAVGLAASLVGVALGWAMHYLFILLLVGLVAADLPQAGFAPAATGLGVGMTLLLAFGLPPVLQLARVPAVRVIRRDVGAISPASFSVVVAGLAGFAGLLMVVAGDPVLGGIAVGGFAAATAVFALVAYGAVRVLRLAVPEARAPRWLVLATRQLGARPAFAVLQVSALAVGLLALTVLVLLRTDLIGSWRAATPADAPNRFVINLQPEQAEDFKHRLAASGIERFDWFPMIRGRLLAINERTVGPDDFKDERAQRLVDREFNLSYADALPAHNTVVAGRFEDGDAASGNDGISVEAGLAATLGLKLGDRLRFDVGGTPVQARITSLRKVDWSSLRVNFFVMFPRASMDEVAVSFIAAFRAPASPAAFDAGLSRDFPNITAIDVGASIAQAQAVLDQVIGAVEFMFVFTLASGLVVLFASVASTREWRTREFAVMRALGASSRLLTQVQCTELLGVGALAGGLAATAALGVGWALAHYVFEFSWTPSPWTPLAGVLSGALLALAAGWSGLRGVLNRPVAQTLRSAAQE